LCCSEQPPVDGGGGGGLSGGSIFLIFGLVLAVVYVGGGMLWRHYKVVDPVTGVPPEGWALLPHRSFWRNFWALVRDGCAFTWRSLRRLTGGSGADHYQVSSASFCLPPLLVLWLTLSGRW
jgi:hypothetical protein